MRSGRSRREWRIILWLSVASAAISAYFGYSIGDPTPHSAIMGVVNSLVIATPILLFEVKGQRLRPLRRLRRQPLLVYFGFRVLFYIVVIIGGLVIVRLLGDDISEVFNDTFRSSVVFSIAMSILANLVFEMGSLLGFGTLKNLLTGRYVQPRREQRAFVLIDMKDSTGLADQLGPIRFHELLNAFSRCRGCRSRMQRGDPQVCRRRSDPDVVSRRRHRRRGLRGLSLRRPGSDRRKQRAVQDAVRRRAPVPRRPALGRDRRR